MTKRILLAGLLGGLAMFLWESVAHMATPLGDMGIRALPDEQAMISLVGQTLRQPGFYFFPGPDYKPGMTAAQKQQAMRAAMDRMSQGPSGILIATPFGSAPLSPGQFVTQFACDCAAMLLAAFLVARALAPTNFRRRAMFVAVLGVFPSLATEIPYLTWYKFPLDYTVAQFIVHVVGFLVGGLVVAWVVKAAAPAKTAMGAA